MICGAADEYDTTTVAVFDNLLACSTAFNNAPHLTPRPFEEKRDGLVVGEGGGAVLLEEYEMAKKRGANILGEIIGFSCNNNGGDLILPNMDGIEATQRIQKNIPTSVVALTAYDVPDLVKEAGKAGVGAYLLKPPNGKELERAITIALARFDDMVELRRLNKELQDALDQVQTLSGLLPICSSCKIIRDEEDHCQPLEVYIRDRSEAEFTHSICPDCAKKLYPDYYKPEMGD